MNILLILKQKKKITGAKLETAFKNTRNVKALGLDSIHLEVWMKQDFNNILLQICIATYNREDIKWRTEACILPVPNKCHLGVKL